MDNEYSILAMIYDPFLFPFLRKIRHAITQMLRGYEHKAVLDVCCGTGNQAKALVKNGFENVHCLDLSKEMLSVAKKGTYARYHIYEKDATDTGFDDATFDAITITLAIHEKDAATQRAMIHEARRIIKPDGVFVVADFILDDTTPAVTRYGIRFIERIVGGEHYQNFREYENGGGLTAIIPASLFLLLHETRLLSNGVVIRVYSPCV